MFDREDVIALFLGVTRHVVEGFALCQKHFQDIALVEFR